MSVELIYEDEHIQLLHMPGTKPVALVTFASFGMPVNKTWFAGRVFCQREHFEGFGFVAKGIGMYPEASVRKALATGLVNPGKPIITYGSSTGSSPALIFAALLNAAGVIISAPIYSLDPAFIPEDDRFARYYVPGLHLGRRVESHHMQGNIVLLYDPHERSDAYHTKLISAQYRGESMTLLPVHFVGHNTIPAPEERELLKSVIDYVLNGGAPAELYQLMRTAKKSKHDYGCVMARRLIHSRKPKTALGVLEAVLRNAGGADAGNQVRRAELAASAYMELRQPARAVEQIETALKLRPSDPHLMEKLGKFLLADHQLGPAITAWRNAIGFASDDPRLQKRLESALEREIKRAAASSQPDQRALPAA